MGSQRYKFMNIKDSDILQLSKDEISLGNMIQSVDNPTSDESITLDSDNTGYNDGIMNFGIKKITSSGGIKLNVNVLDLASMTVGSTFNFGKYQVESETPWAIEWEIVHQTDEYQIAQTKQIIDLRCFDAKESTNTDSNRARNGNNNWQYSNIKQFLNSDQATWYSAQHQYDAPPNSSNVLIGNSYDTHKGFLYYFSDEEKSLLKDMTFDLYSYDTKSSYSWTGKVWLPTYTQMSGNQNNNISEGTKFDKYNSDSDRIKTINKYCAENNEYCKTQSKTAGTADMYWMSSAYPSNSYYSRGVNSNGKPTNITSAYAGYSGLAPCICLPRKLGGGVINDTISFYIDDTLYKSPKGYSFSQWVNTSYNYNGWYNDGTNIINYNTNTHIDITSISDVIEDGKKYKSVPNTISFSINNKQKSADPGMTWTQWVNSSYNTDRFSIRDNYVVNDASICHINDVISTDTIISGKNYTISSGSTIAVDLSKVGVGSTFLFGKYQVESESPWAIEWEIVHQTDEYQIAQTKQIIDLRSFDAKEPNNTDSNRKNYGNNNWQYSNIKQFLNSDQATWYSAQHQYDAPPTSANCYQYPNGTTYNAYDSHKGFLYYFSDEEKSLLKDMTLTLANNTKTDGGGSYTWTGKVWLPTYTQMSGNQNNNISEGTKFDKYSDNNSRIKTLHENCAKYNEYCKINNYTSGTAWYYWMSSANPSYSSTTRIVDSGGGPVDGYGACRGYGGLAPCIKLPKSTILWGTSANISFTISDNGSYMGSDFTVRDGASWAEFLKSYTELSANVDGYILGEGDMYLCNSSGTQVKASDQIIANETYSWV